MLFFQFINFCKLLVIKLKHFIKNSNSAKMVFKQNAVSLNDTILKKVNRKHLQTNGY